MSALLWTWWISTCSETPAVAAILSDAWRACTCVSGSHPRPPSEVFRNPPLAGLILVSPLSSGTDMAKQMGLGWLEWCAGTPFDSVRKVARVAVPTLVIHGDRDRVIPIELGRKLYEASPAAVKRFKVVAGAGHNNLTRVAGRRYWTWIKEFLVAHTAEAAHARNQKSRKTSPSPRGSRRRR